MKRRFFTILGLILSGLLWSYDVILPEDEAPAFLFSVGRADENVSLFVAGSWEASVAAGCAFQYIPGTGFLSITSFPDISTGFGFSQAPDLTLSLWYLEKFFFETSLAQDFSDSFFLLGYRGKGDELLREVSIGNTGTELEGYSYLQLPDSPKNSLGARITLGGEAGLLDTVFRYDPAEDRKQSYRGMNLLEESVLEPAEFIRSRFFALPDRETDALRVYVETTADDPAASLTDDDGRSYRPVKDGEIGISTSEGLIHFTSSPAGRVLATYGDMTLTGTVLGTLVSDRVESIDGTDYFLLSAPGKFSPFEVARYYPAAVNLPEESWRIRVYLTENTDSPGEGERLTFRHDIDENIIALTSGAALPFDDTYKYPLADNGLSHIYGPAREDNPSYSRSKIVVQVLTPVDTVEIDPDFLPSSVRVYRNGIPETGYTIDEYGIITFDRDLSPSEEVDVYYSVTSVSGEGGDLVFGSGGRFQVSPDLEITAGIGVVWDMLSGSFSETAGDNAGSVLITGGMEYDTDNLDINVKAGVSISNPDTTGHLRLKGMEESGFPVGITGTSVFPSSVPPGYDASKRGESTYRDYVNYSAVGGDILMDETWTYTEDEYASGSRTGPYVVRPVASDVISGNLAGLTWDIDGTGAWTGAQFRLPGGEIDLSSCRGLSFLLKGEDITDDTELTIQIGSLGEDLDGDGILDEESGEFDDGFAFNDSASGNVFRVGAGPGGLGNGTIETEDADGDGLLDLEDPDQLYTHTIPGTDLPSEDIWVRGRVIFSETDRKKMTACNGIRVIVSSSSGTGNTGTLLFGELRFEGSTFVPGDDTVELAQIVESDITEPLPLPAGLLASYYDETDRVFHSSGTDNEVLDIQWSGDFTILSPVTPVPSGDYGTLVLYFAPLSISGASPEMTVSLTDSAGRGITCSFTPSASSDWHKLEIDTAGGKVYLDDAETDADLAVDDTAGYLTRFSLSMEGTSGGRMLLDEIFLTDPAASLAAGAEADLRWTIPGPVISVGETPVVSNISLSACAGANTTGFLQGITPGKQEPRIVTSVNLEASILGSACSTDLEADYDSGGLSIRGGHSVRFPEESDSYIEDRYVHPDSSGSMERNTRFVLSIPEALSLTLAQAAYQVSGDLVQSWDTEAESLYDGALDASAHIGFIQVSPEYSLSREGYVRDWLGSYRLFAPAASTGSGERTGEASVDLSLKFPPASIDLTPGFSYVYNETEALQTNRGILALTVPFRFGDSALNRMLFDITYRRETVFTLEGVASGSFSGDLELSTAGYGSQNSMFTGIPFYEIFSFTPDTAFGESSRGTDSSYAEYIPSLSFSLLRRYGSFIRDLFLPASLDISFSRELERDMDTWTDSFVTDLAFTSSALNLFGSRGAYPSFAWFETDEYSGSYTLTHYLPLRGSEEELLFVYQGYAALTLPGSTLSGNQRLELDLTDTKVVSYSGSLEYEREKPVKNPPELPFTSKDIEKGMVLSHNELVEARLSSEEETDPLDWTVYARHETSVVLPGFGSVGLFCRIGVKPEIILSGSDEITTWLFAAETGIEGNIRY